MRKRDGKRWRAEADPGVHKGGASRLNVYGKCKIVPTNTNIHAHKLPVNDENKQMNVSYTRYRYIALYGCASWLKGGATADYLVEFMSYYLEGSGT